MKAVSPGPTQKGGMVIRATRPQKLRSRPIREPTRGIRVCTEPAQRP